MTRPLNLRPAEVRQLLAVDRVCVVRLVKVQPQVTTANDASWRDTKSDLWRNARQYARDCSPFGPPGAALVGKEALYRPDGDPWLYKADGVAVVVDKADETAMLVWAHHQERDWCPSTRMPLWASRFPSLRTVSVRVGRVQSVTYEECVAAGFQHVEIPASATWDEAKAAGVQIAKYQDEQGRKVTSFGAKAGFYHDWTAQHGPDAWERNDFVWVAVVKRGGGE